LRGDSLFQDIVEEDMEDDDLPAIMKTFTKIPPKKLKANEFPFVEKLGSTDILKHFELDINVLKKQLIKLDVDEDLDIEDNLDNEANIDEKLLNNYFSNEND
jgi:hypothetical protein